MKVSKKLLSLANEKEKYLLGIESKDPILKKAQSVIKSMIKSRLVMANIKAGIPVKIKISKNGEIKTYFSEIGRKGGKKSKRVLTPEQARAMVKAREANRKKRK